uniref:Uncharacterized protein n=1 Tax=Anguilla anguilla TaxID=7936 RepID=A0A0E9W7B9_ANGAN
MVRVLENRGAGFPTCSHLSSVLYFCKINLMGFELKTYISSA